MEIEERKKEEDPSKLMAILYTTNTTKVKDHRERARNTIVEPLYIGLFITLKGKEVTFSFIKIPK